jgi:hypothetical protein
MEREDVNPESLVEVIEYLCRDGADDECGSVDALGHAQLCIITPEDRGNWGILNQVGGVILYTDSQGFRDPVSYYTADGAREAFDRYAAECYGDDDSEDDDSED